MKLNGIKITWLGHATFRIQTPKGKTILMDPWVMGNPACPEGEKNLKNLDIMLITHGHGDHIGDAVEIAKKHNPKVVGIPELCGWLGKKGVMLLDPNQYSCNMHIRSEAERRTPPTFIAAGLFFEIRVGELIVIAGCNAVAMAQG